MISRLWFAGMVIACCLLQVDFVGFSAQAVAQEAKTKRIQPTNNAASTQNRNYRSNCNSMAGMRCAEQYPGSDCGAKIMAADASFPYPKGIIVVTRKCGMKIETRLVPQHSIWFTEGGIWDVSSPITLTHGGIAFIGQGMNDSTSQPGTLLRWVGPKGLDMVSIHGTAADRIDRIVFQDIILDGGNKARYTMRAEKIDTAELSRVRLRNGAVASFYAVDSTGWKWYNVQLTQCPSFCAVLDWGTGGFYWAGGTIDILTPNTNPGLLIQGSANALHVQGVEFDASETGAFAGYIQINGFDARSAFPGAPLGGVGAPSMVTITDSSFFQHSTSLPPAQGADILVTGTALHRSNKIVIARDYFAGGGISQAAVKMDYTSNPRLSDLLSNSHTASTLIVTENASHVSEEFVTTATEARCTGAACGDRIDITHGRAGEFFLNGALQIGSYVRTSAAEPATSGVVRLGAGESACWRNKTNTKDICIKETVDDTLVGDFRLESHPFSNLGAPADGTIRYCSDCEISSVCAGGSTGAVAKRIHGVWICN